MSSENKFTKTNDVACNNSTLSGINPFQVTVGSCLCIMLSFFGFHEARQRGVRLNRSLQHRVHRNLAKTLVGELFDGNARRSVDAFRLPLAFHSRCVVDKPTLPLCSVFSEASEGFRALPS